MARSAHTNVYFKYAEVNVRNLVREPGMTFIPAIDGAHNHLIMWVRVRHGLLHKDQEEVTKTPNPGITLPTKWQGPCVITQATLR